MNRNMNLKMDAQLLIFALIISIQIITIISTSALIIAPNVISKSDRIIDYRVLNSPFDSSVKLLCEANGYPKPTYMWTKNGQQFNYSMDERITQMANNGTLNICKLNESDEGVYQCLARNDFGTSVSDTISLRRVTGVVVSVDHIVTYAYNNSPLSLECKVANVYTKLYWRIMDSQKFMDIDHIRITDDDNGNLHFSNVTFEDISDNDKYYICWARINNDYIIVRKVMLNTCMTTIERIDVAPVKQFVSPLKVLALMGKALKLYCIFGGTPLPSIKWTKRNAQNASFIWETIDKSLNTSNAGKKLTLANVTDEHSGVYKCEASNEVNETYHIMEVVVESIPYWIRVPNNTTAIIGDNITLECASDGTPKPQLQWYMNGVAVENVTFNSSRMVNESILTIESVGEADRAVYQCNASNVHGYAFHEFYLDVKQFELELESIQSITHSHLYDNPIPLSNTSNIHWTGLLFIQIIAIIIVTFILMATIYCYPLFTRHGVHWVTDRRYNSVDIEVNSNRFQIENRDSINSNLDFNPSASNFADDMENEFCRLSKSQLNACETSV